MNLTIKTEQLQDMVNRAIKCASNNKLIPLTSLMSVKVDNGVLVLTTTDGANFYYVRSASAVQCDDFEVSVLADLFTKLVLKTTSETLTLSVEDNVLEIKGNGTYKMELPLDEGGKIIKFPKKFDEFVNVGKTVKRDDIDRIIAYNKNSLAVSVTLPSLTCYYCGDTVISCDSHMVCSTEMHLFDNDLLISPQLMEILSIFKATEINCSINDDFIIFETANDLVYAPIIEGVDTYPADALNSLLNGEFPSMCKINRDDVLSLLDRLSLFVGSYDKKLIYLTFTNEGVMFNSKKMSGSELVPYIESENFSDYTCAVDINMLQSQLQTQSNETITMYYGSDVAIKFVSEGVTQLVALANEE